MLSLADPGIVLQTRAAFPHLEAEYRGHDGIRRYWHTVSAPFEHLRIEVECVRRRGDDIAILFRFRAQGRGGWEMRARFGQVGHVREGLLTDIVAYGNWDSAAEAIGLRVEDLVL